MRNMVVFGASGGIGDAVLRQLGQRAPDATIHAFSRRSIEGHPANVKLHTLSAYDENGLRAAAEKVRQTGSVDFVFIATGLLHNDEVRPEKSLKDVSAQNFETLFAANTIAPALIAKFFLPHFPKDRRALFAALSARVGSVSDNRLGGWYAYRASKAALNMVIKNAAIEMGRRYPQAIIVGVHPGTVDSALSKPFQANVPEGKLFTPDDSAKKMLHVLDALTPGDTGKCFAWDGQEVLP